MEKWKKRFIKSLYHYDRNKIDIDGAYRIKDRHIPKSLFKYRSFSSEHVNALEKGILYMSYPQNFNDPFDTAVLFESPFPPDNMTASGFANKTGRDLSQCENAISKMCAAGSWKNYLRAELAAGYPDKSHDELDVISRIFLTIGQEREDELEQSFNEKIKGGTLVLSLSEVNDDILMWSHYSSNHTGFVIEYDLSRQPPDDLRRRLCYPVFYSSKIRNFSRYIFGKTARNNLFSSFASCVKLKQWEYEKEWRIVFAHGVTTKKELIMPTPVRIILGVHTCEKDVRRMVGICSRLNIKLMKARLSLKQGKIIIEHLDSTRSG